MPESCCGFPHNLCRSNRTQILESPSLPSTSAVTMARQHCSDSYEISAHRFKFETLTSPPSNNILPAPISATEKFTGLYCLFPLLLTQSWTFNLFSYPHSCCSAPALIYCWDLHQDHLFNCSSQSSSYMKHLGCDTKPQLLPPQLLSKIRVRREH